MESGRLAQVSVPDLLRQFADILSELKARGVVRTRNNPIADYAEWLVAQKLGLRLEPNSKSGYDATDTVGQRFQVKARRLDPSNKSRQLSPIRNLESAPFDYLIAILFHRDFTVKEAYRIPRAVVEKHARFNKHVNGHILDLRGDVLKETGVENVAPALQEQPSLT